MVAFQRMWRHLNGEEIFVVDSRPCLDGFYFLTLSEKERNNPPWSKCQSSVLLRPVLIQLLIDKQESLFSSGGWQAGGSAPTLAPAPILAGSLRNSPRFSPRSAGLALLCPPRLMRTHLFHRSLSQLSLLSRPPSPPLTPHWHLDKE